MIYLHRLLNKPIQVEYRYLPRNLNMFMSDAAFNSDAFEVMFSDEGPWIKAHTSQKLI